MDIGGCLTVFRNVDNIFRIIDFVANWRFYFIYDNCSQRKHDLVVNIEEIITRYQVFIVDIRVASRISP